MAQKTINPANRLYSIAESQQGYFTSSQAVEAGFSDYLHPYHVRKGNWERIHRGIYRLSKYPHSMDSHYVIWSLWSRNRKGEPLGVYSHETALSMYDLSDVNPAKLYMTVPPNFRRHSSIPKILILNKGVLAPGDIATREGYRVTRPTRTIRDLLREGATSKDLIRQAIMQGFSRGLILRREIEPLSKEFPGEKELFNDILMKYTK
jgi:predicted transcriptional regulator of viral defense system